MKIEIHSPVDPSNDYWIYISGTQKRLTHGYGVFRHQWDDDDILKLLGESQYKQFEAGKYTFDLPSWKVNILEGRHVPSNREQLLFSSQF